MREDKDDKPKRIPGRKIKFFLSSEVLSDRCFGHSLIKKTFVSCFIVGRLEIEIGLLENSAQKCEYFSPLFFKSKTLKKLLTVTNIYLILI